MIDFADRQWPHATTLSAPPLSPAGVFSGAGLMLGVLVALTFAGLSMFSPWVPAARARSITTSSVWNKNNALERARQQLPRGATVTKERCDTVEVGRNNPRYRCTVWYDISPDFVSPREPGES